MASILSSANKAPERRKNNPVELHGQTFTGSAGATPLNADAGCGSPWQKRNFLPLPQGQGW
jgi:hypothetical protein